MAGSNLRIVDSFQDYGLGRDAERGSLCRAHAERLGGFALLLSRTQKRAEHSPVSPSQAFANSALPNQYSVFIFFDVTNSLSTAASRRFLLKSPGS